MTQTTTAARRAKMVPILPSRRHDRKPGQTDDRLTVVSWSRSPAFAVNPRAALTHRVRHVDAIIWGEALSHHSVAFLCGNSCNVSERNGPTIDDVLTADPPTDRLLCDRCEFVAARQDLPSGDALAGRHVHRGVMVPKQVCCLKE